jgi:hypothetical protein
MQPHESVHHEISDMDIRAVLGFGVGLLVVGILIHVFVGLLFLYLARHATAQTGLQYPHGRAQENRLPPEPRLQTNPRQDLRDLREGEDKVLNSYGWVDKDTGTVRIPIDQAMKLAVQRGLPAREESHDRR